MQVETNRFANVLLFFKGINIINHPGKGPLNLFGLQATVKSKFIFCYYTKWLCSLGVVYTLFY